MAGGSLEGVLKVLLKVVAGGFLIFMILAIAQRWDYFSSAWFGRTAAEPTLSEEDLKAAADTVHLVLRVMSHFYTSGGDPRFSERMPASDALIREMQADIGYLDRNQRLQEPVLERLEVVAVDDLGGDRVEVRTRELWSFRVLWAATRAEAEPVRSNAVGCRYLLVRGSRGWRVVGWEMLPPGTGEDTESR